MKKLVALMLLLAVCNVYSQKVMKADFYQTAKNTKDRLTKKEAIVFENAAIPNEDFAVVVIDTTKRFQTIEGIGGALTDAAAETFYKLPKAKQDEIISAYFSADKGIGYSLCRTHIHSCDFSSESYIYAEANDPELKKFSVAHDLKYRVPFIKEAIKQTNNNLKLFASPWSPPTWMKTTNNMLNGGKLKPEFAPNWANYYVKFINEYEKLGIPIWGLTVQNEPMAAQTWESCIFNAEEEKDFVKNHLGPTLAKAGLGSKKIMVWDHNRGIMYQRAKVAYEDPEAAKYIWGLAFHWYVGDHFDNVRLVHDAYPNKNLLFSEGCVFPFEFSKINDWNWGEIYGKSIINDFNNWTVAWTDWNVILDQTGGPNHVSNFCYSPIIGDTRDGSVHYMNSYYYIGHFSKFVRPGAKRIVCSLNNDDLLASAFINTDGKVAVIVMNQSDKDIDYSVWLEGKAAKAKSLAHSIATIIL